MNFESMGLEVFIKTSLFGNSLLAWGTAVALGILIALLLRSGKKSLLSRLEKQAVSGSSSTLETMRELLSVTKTTSILILAIFIGALPLALPDSLAKGLNALLLITLIVQSGFWSSQLSRHLIALKRKEHEETQGSGGTAFGFMSIIARAIIWSVVALLVLDNLGVDVTALIAGLGVGGIAVALAVQNILSDLLSSLSIILDKPFEIGDFVSVGEFSGTVEKIGVKTTRVRSLSGEQLIFSNSDLLSSRIRNFKRLSERRIVFALGVVYQTSPSTLKEIPKIIERIISENENVRFDRAHFKNFGDFSLNFEVVYFVLTQDYRVYMDVQEEINLEIASAFEQAGIEFAYPTQTIFFERTEA